MLYVPHVDVRHFTDTFLLSVDTHRLVPRMVSMFPRLMLSLDITLFILKILSDRVKILYYIFILVKQLICKDRIFLMIFKVFGVKKVLFAHKKRAFTVS